MSVEAITEAIHECMDEKLNDSPETEEETSTGYERKERSTVLYSYAVGQKQTNQVYNIQGLTSDSPSKIKIY